MTASDKPTTRVRLHLVGGFLGSGKTTLLRRLLSQGLYGERVVVLVNEFGDVGIDGALLRKGGNEVVELSNGCVCCQIGKDMLRSVFEMIRAYAPQRIVIELTGVAEPGRVLSSLAYSTELMAKARLEPTICVVDCYAFPDLSREMEYFFYCQAQAADLVLLNKADLVTDAQLARVEDAVRESNPRAFFIPTRHCEVDLAALFASARTPAPAHQCDERCQHTKPVFDTFVWRDPEIVLDRRRVEAWLETVPANLFRLKGTVRLAEGPFFLNWVKGSLTWEPSAPEDPQPTSLVFIGQNISPADYDAPVRACSRQKGRRLRLGARVNDFQ